MNAALKFAARAGGAFRVKRREVIRYMPNKQRKFAFGDETMYIREHTYQNGNTAIIAEDTQGDIYAVLSVNMPGTDWLPSGIFFLKDWSENESIAAAFIASGLVAKAKNVMPRNSGFISATAYIWADEAELWEDEMATMYQGEDINNE